MAMTDYHEFGDADHSGYFLFLLFILWHVFLGAFALCLGQPVTAILVVSSSPQGR